jgi:AraC-like DNA-binding protein
MKLYKEFRERDEASALAIEGLALEMLAEVSRRQVRVSDRTPPRWLAQALELLREQFSEHLTITYLATSVGVHPVHLAREFGSSTAVQLGNTFVSFASSMPARACSSDVAGGHCLSAAFLTRVTFPGPSNA